MSTALLAIIAVAVAVMAAIQVAAVIVAARLARRVDHLATTLEQEVRPLFADLRAMSADAARATSMAAAQVERAERVLTAFGSQMDQIFSFIHSNILAPVREGVTLLAGVRAALSALRDLGTPARSARSKPAPDDEESLFIG